MNNENCKRLLHIGCISNDFNIRRYSDGIPYNYTEAKNLLLNGINEVDIRNCIIIPHVEYGQMLVRVDRGRYPGYPLVHPTYCIDIPHIIKDHGIVMLDGSDPLDQIRKQKFIYRIVIRDGVAEYHFNSYDLKVSDLRGDENIFYGGIFKYENKWKQ